MAPSRQRAIAWTTHGGMRKHLERKYFHSDWSFTEYFRKGPNSVICQFQVMAWRRNPLQTTHLVTLKPEKWPTLSSRKYLYLEFHILLFVMVVCVHQCAFFVIVCLFILQYFVNIFAILPAILTSFGFWSGFFIHGIPKRPILCL